jgi:hypothetical protein
MFVLPNGLALRLHDHLLDFFWVGGHSSLGVCEYLIEVSSALLSACLGLAAFALRGRSLEEEGGGEEQARSEEFASNHL